MRPGLDDIARLWEHMPLAMVAMHPNDGTITFWNAAAEMLFGYAKDDVIGASVAALMPDGLQGQHDANVTAFITTNASDVAAWDVPRRLNVSALRKDGGVIRVALTFVGLPGAPPEGARLFAFARELPADQAGPSAPTALPRRLDTLLAIGRMAAGVAHDVNNSLAALVAPLEWLRLSIDAGTASWADVRRELEFMDRVVQDAAATVQRLQLFARGDGERRQNYQPVLLDALLDDVILLTRARWRDQARAEGRHITVRAQPGNVPAVYANPADLREALVNLVNNAVDAMPRGGVLTLATGMRRSFGSPPRAVLTVSDTGTGIDEQTRAHLFEALYTTKGPERGFGLGLVMVAEVVREHGGTVEVESEPGKGSVFRILLPVSAQDGPDKPEALPRPTPGARAPQSILLVEDEDGLRGVVVRLLQREGHQVTAAASGEEALRLLAQTPPPAIDAVIADIGLRGMSGWQLTAALHDQYPALKVILATGWAGGITDDQLAAAGMTRRALVAKPYRLEDLHRALDP